MSTADVADPAAALNAVHIRHLRAEDLSALEWEGEYTHFRRVYALAYQRALRGDAVLWLAEVDGRVIGQVFVLLRSETDPDTADGKHHAFIHSFRVRPDFQSMGIGTKLIQTAEADLKTRGFSSVALNVGIENQGAARLYQRLGYKKEHQVSGHWIYEDHLGNQHELHEPGWRLSKSIANNK